MSKFADNSIRCLDDLLGYSKEKDTQEIDFDDLKLELVDGSIWSLLNLFKYFDGIDLYNLDGVTKEQISASKVKRFLSDLGNLKYFAPQAFLDLFYNKTSLLSNPKVCSLLNVKVPQGEKDSVWKLKLKLVVMYIITFGFYHFLEYDKEAIDNISKAEYLNGDYFEKIKANYLKPESLLSIVFNNNKKSTKELVEASKAVTKLKQCNKRIGRRIQAVATKTKKYE